MFRWCCSTSSRTHWPMRFSRSCKGTAAASSGDMIIEVPRPARLSGPDPRPPEQITLPLAVRCWVGIAQYLMFPLAAVAVVVLGLSEWTPGRVVLAALAVFGVVAMFVAWRDSRDPRPVLVITAEHIHDRRVTAHPIPWSEVRS